MGCVLVVVQCLFLVPCMILLILDILNNSPYQLFVFYVVVVTSPLTTPEEAQEFLRTMRKQQRDFSSLKQHKPPSNLSADGMDAWYLQQKQREQELRKRRQEAEALLRGYRGSAYVAGSGSCRGFGSPRAFGSPMSGISETLDDPDCHSVHGGGTPCRRHTIHAGDIPNHLLPPGRALANDFDREGGENNANNNSYLSASPSVKETKDKYESEEKKDDDMPRTVPGHIQDRSFFVGQTPLPNEEKIAKTHLPETIWRDFISSGKIFVPDTAFAWPQFL